MESNTDSTELHVSTRIIHPMDMFTKQRIWEAFEESHLRLMDLREFCEKKHKNEVLTREDVLNFIDRDL